MSRRSELVDAALLRDWPLPEPGGSKDARGRVVVVGGSPRTPGAVLLTGLAVLPLLPETRNQPLPEE